MDLTSELLTNSCSGNGSLHTTRSLTRTFVLFSSWRWIKKRRSISAFLTHSNNVKCCPSNNWNSVWNLWLIVTAFVQRTPLSFLTNELFKPLGLWLRLNRTNAQTFQSFVSFISTCCSLTKKYQESKLHVQGDLKCTKVGDVVWGCRSFFWSEVK